MRNAQGRKAEGGGLKAESLNECVCTQHFDILRDSVVNPSYDGPMYDKILVTLDATPTDRAIIDHVKLLAKTMGSRIVLLHVATGWAARTYGSDAVHREIDENTAYLQSVKAELEAGAIQTEAQLAYGDPASQIIRWIQTEGCDLVAMSTHGHRFLGDLLYGTTATRVQHRVNVPVLLLRAE